METNEIKLPLVSSTHHQIVDADGHLVAQLFPGAIGIEAAGQAQALLIVACNAHAKLVGAAQAAKAVFDAQKWRPMSTERESVALRKLNEALTAAGAV